MAEDPASDWGDTHNIQETRHSSAAVRSSTPQITMGDVHNLEPLDTSIFTDLHDTATSMDQNGGGQSADDAAIDLAALDNILNNPWGGDCASPDPASQTASDPVIQQSDAFIQSPDTVIPSVEATSTSISRPCLGFDLGDDEDHRGNFVLASGQSGMRKTGVEDEHYSDLEDDEEMIEPLPIGDFAEADDETSLFVSDRPSASYGPRETPVMRPIQKLPHVPPPQPATSSHPSVAPIHASVTNLSQFGPATSSNPSGQPITIGKLGLLKARKKKAEAQNSTPVTPPVHQPAFHNATSTKYTSLSGLDDYDEHNMRAEADFLKQKRHYDRLKQRNGKLSFTEEVAWLRIYNTEIARTQKLKKDAKMERQNDEMQLFPDDINMDDPANQGNDSEEEVVDLDAINKRKRPDMPHKQTTQLSLQEAELQAMGVGLEVLKDAPKKKKARIADDPSLTSAQACGSNKVTTSRSTGKGRGKGKGKAVTITTPVPSPGPATRKALRRTAKDKRATERAVKQAASLFGANVFRQQAPQDAPAQPTFSTRNKQEAFKQMLSTLHVGEGKQAKSDIHELKSAIMDFNGRASVKPAGDGMWLVDGMATSLKAYQIMGTAFMRRRENDANEPRGGLLADQMGLGKTLMMLANIVNGRPSPDSPHKATLIVASAGLLSQWGREIGLHTNCGLTIMKYTTGSRIDSNHTLDIIGSHDIILTSYTEVMRSYPKNEPPIECQTTEEKVAWWKEVYDKNRGNLHRIMFHRVVLDEAQAIKNHMGRTSIACRALLAKHKWALSGTPIVNGLTELYPYFKFLGVPCTGSFRIFKNNYCDLGNAENNERLLVRLAQFMLRRTHDDEWGGAPILKLPPAGQMTQWCDFNPVERSIYNIIQTRFVTLINHWSSQKKLDKSYGNVLVMLLRLRQLTSSLLMLQFVMEDLAEREDLEQIKSIIRDPEYNNSTSQGQLILNLRKQLEGWTEPCGEGSIQNLDEFDGEEALETPSANTGKEFGKKFDFKPYLNSLTTGDHWREVKQRSKCNMCSGLQDQGGATWMTSCNHLCCGKCYEKKALDSAMTEDEEGVGMYCNACKKNFSHFTHIPPDDADVFPRRDLRSRQSRQRADKTRLRIENQDIKDDWLTLGGDSVLPSAKTIAVKAQIINWIQENPDVKIIIYTQFLAMIKILAKMCQEEGWMTVQYHGKLSFTSRDNAIKSFANNRDARILLASLRCGGLGLNLTMASKVMILDPWWNEAAEQQAFCRVYRFGQQEPTFLTRLCVKNTVDERLIEMQERKQAEIDEVMEDKGKTTGALNIRDLMRLFGNLEEDEDGNPFIVVDNPDPRGGFMADADHEGYADDL